MGKYHIPHEAVGVITYAFPNLSSIWLVTGDPENSAGTWMALTLQENFMMPFRNSSSEVRSVS